MFNYQKKKAIEDIYLINTRKFKQISSFVATLLVRG